MLSHNIEPVAMSFQIVFLQTTQAQG